MPISIAHFAEPVDLVVNANLLNLVDLIDSVDPSDLVDTANLVNFIYRRPRR